MSVIEAGGSTEVIPEDTEQAQLVAQAAGEIAMPEGAKLDYAHIVTYPSNLPTVDIAIGQLAFSSGTNTKPISIG